MDGGVSRKPRFQSGGVRVVAKFVDHGEGAQSSEGDPARMNVSFSDDGRAFVSTSIEAKHSRTIERSVYQLDTCYEEEKGVEEIYEVEVKPLIQRLFDGSNCCVISYGAHRSWPAQLFQGSGENPSLVEKAMIEILHRNGEGLEVSDYEVFQDQIYDLLEPKGKGVQLKDLSKVKINTLDEFKSYYCQNSRLIKGHRGIVIYITNSSKFKFLDLGGYGGATENKSLHAVMKIVYAMNSNNFISYRDSRFTHQLHDFLSFESGSVVIACLSRNNNQHNRRALMLASSSSQAANQILFNSIRRPTKKNVAPLERRYSMSVTQMKPVYEKVNGCASVRRAIKKPGFLKDRVQSCAAKSMAKLTLNEDLVYRTEVEKPTLEEDMHEELADIQGSTMTPIQQEDMHGEFTDIQESTMTGVQQEVLSEGLEAMSASNTVVDNEESSDNGITNVLNLDIQIKDICCVNEEHDCRTVMEETSSNQTTSEDSRAEEELEEELQTPARLPEPSPKVTDLLREMSNSLNFIANNERQNHIVTPKRVSFSSCTGFRDSALQITNMPQDSLMACTTDMKKSLQRGCLSYINSANKEDLKRLKGIGEVRANRILQLRDNNPEPFKDVEDLKNIGINPRQFDKMVLNFFEDC